MDPSAAGLGNVHFVIFIFVLDINMWGIYISYIFILDGVCGPFGRRVRES